MVTCVIPFHVTLIPNFHDLKFWICRQNEKNVSVSCGFFGQFIEIQILNRKDNKLCRLTSWLVVWKLLIIYIKSNVLQFCLNFLQFQEKCQATTFFNNLATFVIVNIQCCQICLQNHPLETNSLSIKILKWDFQILNKALFFKNWSQMQKKCARDTKIYWKPW